ncbi:hypothetical protein HYQ46_008081 [Verticillium longisporum]|nr:hypothetical protein HYQ46_008081 [Verticillium longisporum]
MRKILATRGKASLPEASLDGSIIAGDAAGERQHEGDAVFSGAVGANLRAGRLVSRAGNGNRLLLEEAEIKRAVAQTSGQEQLEIG